MGSIEYGLREAFQNAYVSIHESIHLEHHLFGFFELVFIVTISYQLPPHSPKCWNTSSDWPSSLWAITITNLASLLRELYRTFAWIIGTNICMFPLPDKPLILPWCIPMGSNVWLKIRNPLYILSSYVEYKTLLEFIFNLLIYNLFIKSVNQTFFFFHWHKDEIYVTYFYY